MMTMNYNSLNKPIQKSLLQSTNASYYILLHMNRNHTENFQVLIKIYHHLEANKESVKLGTPEISSFNVIEML